jgi:hypothetical protein
VVCFFISDILSRPYNDPVQGDWQQCINDDLAKKGSPDIEQTNFEGIIRRLEMYKDSIGQTGDEKALGAIDAYITELKKQPASAWPSLGPTDKTQQQQDVQQQQQQPPLNNGSRGNGSGGSVQEIVGRAVALNQTTKDRLFALFQ